MLTNDRINKAIEHLAKLAGQNQDPRVTQFIIAVAQELKAARGNVQKANAILDDAIFTVENKGIHESMIERGR